MYQQIMLIGNLGGDPEMRYLENGTPVTNFSLAVNKTWTGQDGQRQEKTIWFRIEAWQRRAEVVSQYLTKGSRVMVVGEVKEARAWLDKDGNPRASIEITATEIKFLGGNNGGQEGGQPQVEPGAQPVATEDIPF